MPNWFVQAAQSTLTLLEGRCMEGSYLYKFPEIFQPTTSQDLSLEASIFEMIKIIYPPITLSAEIAGLPQLYYRVVKGPGGFQGEGVP